MKMHCIKITWAPEQDEHASFLTAEIMKAVHGFNSRSPESKGAVAAPLFRHFDDELNCGVIMISDESLDHFFLHARIAAACQVEIEDFYADAKSMNIEIGRLRYRSPSQVRREALYKAEKFGVSDADKKEIYEKAYKAGIALRNEKAKTLKRSFSRGNPYFWFQSKGSVGSSPAPIFWKISKASRGCQFIYRNTLGMGITPLPNSIMSNNTEFQVKLLYNHIVT